MHTRALTRVSYRLWRADRVPTSMPFREIEIAYVHAPCSDGYASAAVLHAVHPKIEIRLYIHGISKVTPDDVRGKQVAFVDCCPADQGGRPVLKELVAASKTMTVVDHHPSTWDQLVRNGWSDEKSRPANLKVFLDRTEKVAASLMVWRLLHGEAAEPPSWLINIARFDVGEFDVMTDDERALHCGLTSTTSTGHWEPLYELSRGWRQETERRMIDLYTGTWTTTKQAIHSVLDEKRNNLEHVEFGPDKIKAIYVGMHEHEWTLVADLPAFIARKWPEIELIFARRWLPAVVPG